MSYIFSLLFILSVKETSKVVLTYESAEKSSSVFIPLCCTSNLVSMVPFCWSPKDPGDKQERRLGTRLLHKVALSGICG